MSVRSPEEGCGCVGLRMLVFIGIVSVGLGFLGLRDVVEHGWNWDRVMMLVPAGVMFAYLQLRFGIVGPPNVRKDE